MRYNYIDLIDFEIEKIPFEVQGEQTPAIFFKINWQNPRLTHMLTEEDGEELVTQTGVSFNASNGYGICSYDYPDILDHLMYIQGHDTDSHSDKFPFPSEAIRNRIYDNLLMAMAEFATHEGSWLQGSIPEPKQLPLWE